MTSGFHYELIVPTSKWLSAVQCYYEVDIDPERLPEGYLHTILPFIGAEWIFTLTGKSLTVKQDRLEKNPNNYISTQNTFSQTLLFEGISKFFIVRFQPYFLTLVCPKPFQNNKRLYPQHLFGTKCINVGDLKQVAEFKQRVSLFEDFLNWRLNNDLFKSGPQDLISHSQDLSGATGEILLLAKRLGISVRQLERRFKYFIRLTPTDFFKLKRLDKALSLYASAPDFSGTDATYIGGFSDQAHFINNFKHYLNDTPTAFFKKRPFLRKKETS